MSGDRRHGVRWICERDRLRFDSGVDPEVCWTTIGRRDRGDIIVAGPAVEGTAKSGEKKCRGVPKGGEEARGYRAGNIRERRSKDRSIGSRDDGIWMSGESDFARLTSALTDAIRMSSRQAKRVANKQVLSEFDPKVGGVSVSEWLKKIDEFSKVFHWKDTDKVYFATNELQGSGTTG